MPDAFPRRTELPSLARIILKQLLRLRAEDGIEEADFEQKLQRLEREELTARGLQVRQRQLPGGEIRFLVVYAKDGLVCEIVDGPAKETKKSPAPPTWRQIAPHGQKRKHSPPAPSFHQFWGGLRPAQ